MRGRVRVKICCIRSRDEAALAVRYGASALGLVSAMPSGPGVVADGVIADVAAELPPGVTSVLLTSRVREDEVVRQQKELRVAAIQLCDFLADGSPDGLRRRLPGVAVMQVIHVEGERSIDEALAVAPQVDALLLDSGSKTAETKRLGGTGLVHDWRVSRTIVESAGRPVYLAGGLHAENVAEAIATVRPFGVDVCTGVRSDGHLDEEKLGAFMAAVEGASAQTTREASGLARLG